MSLVKVNTALLGNQRPTADKEFKEKREIVLGRLVQLAFVAKEAGDAALSAALLDLREAVIPLDAHPLVTAAPDHDLQALRVAYTQAYKSVCVAALATAPDTPTALAWKVEIDKVFK
jgi:hypothetical protein